MPEYCLPDSYAAGFKALDSFTQGYIECLFFTENGNDGISEDAGFLDLAPEALERIKSDCADFQIANAADLAIYEEARSMEHAGHDFWLTRNGHGAGFWDRGLGELGERLSTAANAYGECYVYAGDDGKIYEGI